ncbi:MAG: glucosidase [Nitrospirales bacterium]|nr:glucosidase [Nitrospira sp.]MDR4502711.1 glucosidase [Nitrospirales bacterium]
MKSAQRRKTKAPTRGSRQTPKTAEHRRLDESNRRMKHWKRWGPYLSERQWGTVREDYSADGSAWEYFPHDHARSRTYRWGEDGLGGICDRHQYICFALALWNGQDPILKERLFGLTNLEGNHGEDVKEYYFYLDSTPTHSYMKFLYKYPHQAFPYAQLLEQSQQRDRQTGEFELLDTGIFQENRYFDVFVEYAKATPDDIAIKITAFNRGPDPASLTLCPTLWFRNTWSWGTERDKPILRHIPSAKGVRTVEAEHVYYGKRWLICDGNPELLFTENESNTEQIWGTPNRTPYVKDAFHRYLIHDDPHAVNPDRIGTKTAACYQLRISPNTSQTVKLRLTDQRPSGAEFGSQFDSIFIKRKTEAYEFYAMRSEGLSFEQQCIQRQAFAGLLWSKQFYYYDVRTWSQGDPSGPPVPAGRDEIRNGNWGHLYNADVISMPDKWEYPWYATWDLAFHCIPLAQIDPDFAKEQLLLFLREWYMHPNGQLPAYEWSLDDVNPPVHAWAAWRVYKIDRRITGKADRYFLEQVFHKLLLNFTWWVNRKDPDGKNLFQGGFLGLDNIGIFDRSKQLPTGGHFDQSDGTSWMAMYCLNMLAMALELAKFNLAYEGVASKFFEHFVYITDAINGKGDDCLDLWDEQDGFYYDVLHLPNGDPHKIKIRSIVGLISLFAVETLEPEMIEVLPGFKRRMNWFLDNRPEFARHVETSIRSDGEIRRMLSIVGKDRLTRILKVMLDEQEFFSPYGIRSLSKYHQKVPFVFPFNGDTYQVDYEPAESTVPDFGGNSNWRGPIWFPVNFLLVESLQKFHHFFGDSYRVDCPSGSGHYRSLWEVAGELSYRLMKIFLKDEFHHRPVYGNIPEFQHDPNWQELIQFYEYFHGENGSGLGASHQTGWTALIAKLIEQYPLKM